MAFNVGLSGKATANADRWLRYHVSVTTVLGKTNLVQWHADRAYQARDIYTISIAAWRLQLRDETDGITDERLWSVTPLRHQLCI